jgi:S-DNA-T family DNA segregation ATPase FtsK/SpoIIIE
MEESIMTTEPTDRERNAEVVQLRAVEAPTEVRLDEDQAAGPAYVDITSTGEKRRPVIPEHWRSGEAARKHVGLIAARHGHRAAYHGVRSPAYFARSLAFSVWGVVVTVRRILAWWHIPGATKLEWEAAAKGSLNDHLRLHKQGRETRKARGTILAFCLVLLAAAVVAMVLLAPWWGWGLAAVVLYASFALAGRPNGKTITSKAVLPSDVAPPTADVIVRALGAMGISQINAAIKDGPPINFPSPVREDGPGWRFEVDLPYGVTATQIIERREQLASGLRRPLGAVWPEVVSHEHAGRLECWVGRVDISKAKPAPWPWLRTGGGDVFGPFPFGTDPRGRRVDGHVVEHNWLVGSMPGQGKTSAVRVLIAAVALDPTVEMWIHELKGTGDLDPFEQCAHRFISGIDDESIAYAAESLKRLRAEVIERAARLKKIPRELCLDKKINRQIANKRSLRLHPLMGAFDEVQNLFAHPKYGKQAGEDAIFIIKIGRALGVFLILATQRPDKESLPTGVSGNVSTRFCLKVAGQVENDMVLGTSAYKNGARATTFRAKVDAGLGYLKGEENTPQVVRTYYLNGSDTDRAARRARVIRETAGTLSGVALGEYDDAPRRDVLADVVEVFNGDAGLQWPVIAVRLAGRFPERWTATTADAVSAEVRARGVPSVLVKTDGKSARGCRRDDVESAVNAS